MLTEKYPSSEETRVALEGLQSLYIDANRVEEYLEYRESIAGTTISTVAKSHEDSISFIAAERVYARENYKEAIAWAVEQGITNGTSDTTFSPGKTCTRAQIVTFLWRAAQKGLI